MAQLFEVIFDDLRSSKKNVNRLLGLGILFALIGHIYGIEPYFHFKAQKLKLSELNKIVRALPETLDNIQNQVTNYTDHLRDVKELIWDALLSGPSSDSLQIGEITLTIKNKIIDDAYQDAVGLYVKKWFPNLIDNFKMPISQLENFENVTGDAENFRKAIDKANDAIKNFKTGLKDLEEKDPDIWKDYADEKKWKEATRKLQELVEKSFGAVKKEIPGLQKITEENIAIVENDIGKLRDSIDALISQFGPVPVSLKDFIVLFPFFMVALLVMITAALHKSGYLYLAFWHEFSKENTTRDRGEFQQFADCWYLPPHKSISAHVADCFAGDRFRNVYQGQFTHNYKC